MNGVFSLENTEREYKKGGNLPTSRHLEIVLGSKLYKTFGGLGLYSPCKPALKCNFGSKLVEVRGYSLFCDEKRIPSITPKRKGRSSR